MTTNSSATGGYLVPGPTPAPLEGQSFEDFLSEVMVGISGLDPTLVRPRWQPEPPNIPAWGTTWMAFGITNYKADTFAVEIHHPEIDGNTEFQRHEEVTILCSFYGPDAVKAACIMRDGFQIDQNREVLNLNGMGLVETTEIRPAPTLTKDRWLQRMDMNLIIRRAVYRTYPILNLLSAQGILDTEVEQVPFVVTP